MNNYTRGLQITAINLDESASERGSENIINVWFNDYIFSPHDYIGFKMRFVFPFGINHEIRSIQGTLEGRKINEDLQVMQTSGISLTFLSPFNYLLQIGHDRETNRKMYSAMVRHKTGHKRVNGACLCSANMHSHTNGKFRGQINLNTFFGSTKGHSLTRLWFPNCIYSK